MDNNKKLLEGLLKADGINPAGATEAEHIAFAKMLDEQSKLKKSKQAYRLDIWRIIMKSRITKFAAAALIIIMVILGLNIIGGPDMAGVAWGDVVKKVEQIEAFIFQHRMSVKGTPGVPEGTTIDIESTIYVSSEHGLRQDQYMGGKAIGVNYVPPSGTIVTSLLPHVKKYIMASMTEEQVRKIHEQVNPVWMIKEFMSFEHTDLGR